MVRVDENANWHAPVQRGNHEGLIRVDVEGRQELRISPASAFKRPQVEKSLLGNACPPPLTKLSFDDVDDRNKPVHLHKCLKTSNWKLLCSKLDELREHEDLFQVNCALSEENDELETTLHTAACPLELLQF